MNYKIVKGIQPSPVEMKICQCLKRAKVKYIREVIFEGCKNPETGMSLRYDFYIPEMNLLIEYDGKQFHKSQQVIARDKIKTKFAADAGIKLIRISGYHNLKLELNELGFTQFDVVKIDDSGLNIEDYLLVLKSDPAKFLEMYCDLYRGRKIKFANKLKRKVPVLMEYPNRKTFDLYRDEILLRLTNN